MDRSAGCSPTESALRWPTLRHGEPRRPRHALVRQPPTLLGHGARCVDDSPRDTLAKLGLMDAGRVDHRRGKGRYRAPVRPDRAVAWTAEVTHDPPETGCGGC